MTDRIACVTRMETALDEACAAVTALNAALDAYEALLPQMECLEAYYTGPQWLADHDADAQGLLPGELKRGVLTEDAVYDLLCDRETLIRRLARLGRRKNDPAAD